MIRAVAVKHGLHMTAGQLAVNLRLLTRSVCCLVVLLLLSTCFAQVPGLGRSKDKTEYGMGLIVNVPYPEAEVASAVADVAQSGIIRGSKEYNKDEYITGAQMVKTTPVFPEWSEDGKVFYKVKLHTLDPREFKDSGDVGTLAVRYVVQPQGENHTLLRIDAIYVEDFRRSTHFSNGSVESSEYKDISDHLAATELIKKETLEAERLKQTARDRAASAELHGPPPEPASSSSRDTLTEDVPASTMQPAAAAPSTETPQTLDEHVKQLRAQVVRAVKSPGAPLKSAPFQTASTLKSLPTGTEVLVVISTNYWYGVETHEGEHGWISRDELEAAK